MNKHVREMKSKAEAEFPVPAHVRKFVGQPALLKHEDERRYWIVFSGLLRASGADDHYGWLLVRNAVDQTWDLQRLARAKACLLDAAEIDGVFDVLVKIHPGEQNEIVETYLREWFEDPTAKNEHLKVMAKWGFSAESIGGLAFTQRLHDLEVLGRMIEQAMILRAAAMKNIDAHRARVHEAGRTRPTPIAMEEVLETTAALPKPE